jgi:hypothetical protein
VHACEPRARPPSIAGVPRLSLLPDQPRSTASPSSSFPREESTSRARRSHRRRRFSPQTRGCRHRLRHRRPSSGPGDFSSELRVRLWSCWTLSPPLSRVGAPPPCSLAGAPPWPWLAWPLARLACLVGLGPQQSVTLGQVNLGAKCSASYFISRKFQRNANTCLIHRIFFVLQKNMNYISKCSGKHDLHSCIDIMHC